MISAVADPPADDWINVPQAARLLGLRLHTVYALIDRGELRGKTTVATDRPKGRRSFCLRRRDVDEYLARARVQPGDLRHLFPPAEGRYR